MAITDFAGSVAHTARAIIYRQLITDQPIDLLQAAATLAWWWTLPARGVEQEEPGAALNNTAIVIIHSAFSQIEEMRRADILDDARRLGIGQTDRHALGRRIGQRRVLANFLVPVSA